MSYATERESPWRRSPALRLSVPYGHRTNEAFHKINRKELMKIAVVMEIKNPNGTVDRVNDEYCRDKTPEQIQQTLDRITEILSRAEARRIREAAANKQIKSE